MESATTLGLNRTGTQMSPLATNKMQSYADEHLPTGPAGSDITSVRLDYVHEAERLGSVPLPGTLTGAVTTGISKLTGKKPEVLVDKLGERLAFERTGVRLYQALIDKVAALDGQTLPFAIADLKLIRDQELEHMRIVAAALESLGADPTAVTPCADVTAVASSGVVQVLTDPRTTVSQCLNAILTAELTDNANWELLIRLTDNAGQSELLPDFQRAHSVEDEHLRKVRDWLSSLILQEAA